MKLAKAALLAAAVTAAGAPGLAHARGGWGFGWGLGLGVALSAPIIASAYYSPYYYRPNYYAPPYYLPYAYAPAYAPQYVQPAYAQQPAAPAPEASWYFCPSSNGYYPYVRSCASGWQAISPRPPGL